MAESKEKNERNAYILIAILALIACLFGCGLTWVIPYCGTDSTETFTYFCKDILESIKAVSLNILTELFGAVITFYVIQRLFRLDFPASSKSQAADEDNQKLFQALHILVRNQQLSIEAIKTFDRLKIIPHKQVIQLQNIILRPPK